MKDPLERFESAGWVASNEATGETIVRLYCQESPPHHDPAEALHKCPYQEDVCDNHDFLCSCCDLHTDACFDDI